MNRQYVFLILSSIYFLVTVYQIVQTFYEPQVGPIGNGQVGFEIYAYLFFATLGSASLLALSIYQFVHKKKEVNS